MRNLLLAILAVALTGCNDKPEKPITTVYHKGDAVPEFVESISATIPVNLTFNGAAVVDRYTSQTEVWCDAGVCLKIVAGDGKGKKWKALCIAIDTCMAEVRQDSKNTHFVINGNKTVFRPKNCDKTQKRIKEATHEK